MESRLSEPSLPLRRPARTLATPVGLPSMRELSRVVTNLAAATSLTAGVTQLQHDLATLLHLSEARCLWIDWGRRAVWSTSGLIGEQTCDLVLDVAASGKRELLASTMLQPAGARPARVVFVLRRPSGACFDLTELAMISTLAFGLSGSLDRLIASNAARGSR